MTPGSQYGLTVEASPQQVLLGMLNQMRIVRAIQVVASLRLADRVSAVKPVGELAREVEVNEEALYRLLRALTSVNIFREERPRCFAHTPLSEALRTNVPGSLAPMAAMLGDEWSWRAWGQLEDCLRTGQPVIPQIYGVDSLWEYLADHPDAGRRFDAAMTSTYVPTNLPIAQAYDFTGVKKIMDLGGGQGSLLATILTQHRHLQGILFDQPSVIANATGFEADLKERLELCSGDFFQEVPPGAEIYLLRQVLHDWDNESCKRILLNCRRSIQPTGRLLIIERVIGPNSPAVDLFLDVQHLLYLAGGRERTEEEFTKLLESAGFYLTKIIATGTPFALLEAAPV